MNNIKIDYKKLGEICLADEKILIPEGEYYYKDNGSNILAVAHCDYISKGKVEYLNYKYKGDDFVLCESLDDRLGVYIITELLPSLGIVVDVLLTTDEEMGKSTASLFDTPKGKEYNWMFSFDRRGIDIVAYEYDDSKLRDMVRKTTGKTLAYGSFSDIVFLSHLGIKGINFGTGYYDEHTVYCSAVGRDIQRGVGSFMNFYRKYKNTLIPHTIKTTRRYGYYDDYTGQEPAYSRDGIQITAGSTTHASKLYDAKGNTIYDSDDDDYTDWSSKVHMGVCAFCGREDMVRYHTWFEGEICQSCVDNSDIVWEADDDETECDLCGSITTVGESRYIDTGLLTGKVVACTACLDYIAEQLRLGKKMDEILL